MAIIKCKICGGDLDLTPGLTVAECEYCGTKQTLPKANEEVIRNLFNRAHALRLKCEFDKAEQIYEKIVQEDNTEAEAHWGIVLCKYGIEYVEDPKTYKRTPTCHRTSYDAVTADADYLAAIQYADATQRGIYEAEAKAIDEIQKNILTIVKEEKPFDVFLCYKETDEDGKRTMDSAIANDIYHQLTQEGLKVFYAAITLETKLGHAYEPYIFAALNTAKVMLVIGTKPQYFTAVWVKNEWSRFMKLMKTDRSKLLIPCYRDMDAYELPEEFSHLQAQDMGKIGFINDIVRGIKKVTGKAEPQPTVVKETVVAGNTNIAPLLKRAFMFLEDGDWTSANEYCEKVLDIDPECAQAYLGKLMAELRIKKQEGLKDCEKPFDGNNHYQKVLRFADNDLKASLSGYIDQINTRNENARKDGIYRNAVAKMGSNSIDDCKRAINLFASIPGWKDAGEKLTLCQEKIKELEAQEEAERLERERQAEVARKNGIYSAALAKMKDDSIASYGEAIRLFKCVVGWRDSDEKAKLCQEKIKELKAQEELYWKESENKAKRNMAIALVVVFVCLAIIGFIIFREVVIIPSNMYNEAIELMESGDYSEAISIFQSLDGYKDSNTKLTTCKIAQNTAILEDNYDDAIALMEDGKYAEAIIAFDALDDYKDSLDKLAECKTAIKTASLDAAYDEAVSLMEEGKYNEAITAFQALDGFKDSAEKILACESALSTATLEQEYNKAVDAMNAGDLGNAILAFQALDGYKDSEEMAKLCCYHSAVSLEAGGYDQKAAMYFGAVGDYKDAKERSFALWDKIAVRETISAGNNHTIGLMTDSAVVSVGYNGSNKCDVGTWRNINAVSAGWNHTVGLKPDGTVVAVGYNDNSQCNVSNWENIVAISAGGNYTVGLQTDGMVVAAGDNASGQCEVSAWKDIVAISAGGSCTIGMQSDGTVVAVGNNYYGQRDVSGWKDIVAISAGDSHTVGLKSDGTVVAVGKNDDGQCNVSDWQDIVAISAGNFYSIGLKADGTVVVAGWLPGQSKVDDWQDIVAISAGSTYAIGLKADGTVVADGDNDYGQCNVGDWQNIRVPN